MATVIWNSQNAGVDKGVALHKLAQILNIAADETMAVGDTEKRHGYRKTPHTSAWPWEMQPMSLRHRLITSPTQTKIDGVAKAIRHFMG